MRIIYLVFGLFFIVQLNAQTQPPNFCGTVGKTPWLIKYQQNRQAFATESADSNWLYMPVTFFIVGNDAGAGYFPISRVFKALCHMNSQFVSARIKCYLHPTLPFKYLNKTSWYEHDWDGGDELINTNYISDRLNAFIVQDPAGNCGYSWQDAIVLGKNCSGETNSTWGHELGHHLSLPHPFFGWEGRTANPSMPAPRNLGFGNPVEKVDRTNCLDAGDGFCDTEADYISNRWNCNSNGLSSQYLDPDSVAFRSDGSYLMGYANDECQNRFMPDQMEAMRANLNDEHISYLVTNQHGPVIANDAGAQLISPLDSAVIPFNNASFSWNPVPNAEFYSLEIGFFSTFSPLLHTTVITTGATSYQYTNGLPKNRALYWRVRAFNSWDVCLEQTNPQVGTFLSVDVSGTNELERAYQVSLSPNPATVGQDAQLNIDADQTEDVTLDLYDLNGRLAWTKNVRIYSGEQSLNIPTGQLLGGHYRLTIRNQRGIITQPLIVLE